MVNFSALFLSAKRLAEVVSGPVVPYLQSVAAISDLAPGLQGRVQVVAAVETAILEWLRGTKPPSLGELIIERRLTAGALFTHFGPFTGKGILDAAARYADDEQPRREARIRAKLDSFSAGATLDIQVHPENYTTTSSTYELSGRKRLFVVGRLTDHILPGLRAQAYAVGYFNNEPRPDGADGDPLGRMPWHMEVYPLQIDNFSRIADIPAPTQKELKRLGDISEAEIKQAFATLVDQPYVPKDWGGERSDLVSTRVRLGGRPAATAFAFKGPSKFKPLTVADLGKHGDQISRLFTEPADLIVLQHCHEVTSAVRDHMRAFATRIGQLRQFCIIDGADTAQILKAYGLLGFKSR